MEQIGQFYAPAILPQGKDPPPHITHGKEDLVGPKTHLGSLEKSRIIRSYWESNNFFSVFGVLLTVNLSIFIFN